MNILRTQLLLILIISAAWLSQPAASEDSDTKSLAEITGRSSKDKDKNDVYPRRLFNLGGFRPMMRLLGMMGIPLLPLLLLRGLVTSGAGGAAAPNQGLGGGGGLGSLGALGLIAPFGMGGGLGGLRPLGGGGVGPGFSGLRPLRPGGFRPGGLANLIGNAAGAGQGGAGGGGGGNAAALFLKKRSTDEQHPSSGSFSNFLKAVVKLEKVFDLYDLTVPDCQRLIVCEVHKKGLNPSVGSFTEKLIQAFGIESRLERSRFRSNTKTVLKDFLKAARIGLQQKNCETVYNRCPAAVSRTSIRKGKV